MKTTMAITVLDAIAHVSLMKLYMIDTIIMSLLNYLCVNYHYLPTSSLLKVVSVEI